MKTRRLYYEDQYQHSFSARVIASKPGWVELDQTAFYPEGGGEPADHGWLDDLAVTDVQVDADGTVWHRLATELATGTVVNGRIDWSRRFDYMQQHTGQHVLSQACWQLYQAATVGFHLGEQVVTIDLDQSQLGSSELEQVEELANATIRSGYQVVAEFVPPDALPLQELRKLPKVTSDIRLVAIGNYDLCPCGGTHVRHLGEVGLLKILSAEKHKGNLRVSFVAGRRAYSDYRDKHRSLQQLSALLSQPIPEVVAGVTKQTLRIDQLEKQLSTLQSAMLAQEAGQLRATGSSVDNTLVVCVELAGRSLASAKELAALLTADSQSVACFGVPDEDYRLVLAISPSLQLHAGNLLKPLLTSVGGKGGGSAQQAQGAVPAERGAETLLALKQTVVRLLSGSC